MSIQPDKCCNNKTEKQKECRTGTAILNSRAGLKTGNMIKHVMLMAEISKSVTM